MFHYTKFLNKIAKNLSSTDSFLPDFNFSMEISYPVFFLAAIHSGTVNSSCISCLGDGGVVGPLSRYRKSLAYDIITADLLIVLLCNTFWVRMRYNPCCVTRGTLFKDTTIFLQSRNGMKWLFVKLLMLNIVIQTGFLNANFMNCI